MPPFLAPLLALSTVLLTLVSPALATADVPSGKPLYSSGPTNRILMGGEWLFRDDKAAVGVTQRFMSQTSAEGWTPITVPNAWNAQDISDESMRGHPVWYRKDFTLPSAASGLDWKVRFESVNYRARVWLNGRPVGSHTGAYLPWEVSLPGLKRRGVNRLVLRIDNRRFPTDFPPSAFSATGVPTGGWWNYGGILREVYLRRIDRVDFAQVIVRPNLPCARCAASVDHTVTVRNYSPTTQRVRLTGRFGTKRLDFGAAAVPARSSRVFTRRITVRRPRLWSPADPNLYRVRLAAAVGRGRSAATTRYQLESGIRSIKVVGGRLYLNGQPMNFRGVSMHEDDPKVGFAIDNATRERFIADTKEVGATVLRAHYPLHPYIHELADRNGILVWSEIPVYNIKTKYLRDPDVRRLAAEELRANIEANQNHPSIMLWSVGNELSARPGPVQGYYIARAANLAKRLDPTRPTAVAVAAYPSAGCQTEYGPLDILGINEYFGWYPGPGGQLADREGLSGYLDQVRACYPDKAIVVSEFGAEANREGPVEEKGTFAFQSDFINYHLGVLNSKPWLSGALYWTLKEFKVRPGWDGGNPRPNSPLHQKAVIGYDGTRKPGFTELQRLFRGTVQYGPAAAGR